MDVIDVGSKQIKQSEDDVKGFLGNWEVWKTNLILTSPNLVLPKKNLEE